MNQRRGRNGARRTVGVLLAGLLLASGCTAPDDDGAAPGATDRAVRAVLDRRAAAVLDHDPAAYLATTDPGATGLRTAQRRELDNLADVPLSSWEYRLRGVTARGSDRATAEVELRYRIKGYDAAPVTSDRVFDLRRDRADGRWYVVGDRAGADQVRQLWQQGDVRVVRGKHSLVLGVGRTEQELRAIAGTADRAVPAVSRAWSERWAGRVVVLVPRTVEDMAGLLGSAPADYRGIAAVTTGRTGSADRNPADRVIVNPQAYGTLSPSGGGSSSPTRPPMSPPAPVPPQRPRPGSPRASRTGWPTARRTARPHRSRPDSRRPSAAATRRPDSPRTRTSASRATRSAWRGRTRAAGRPAR